MCDDTFHIVFFNWIISDMSVKSSDIFNVNHGEFNLLYGIDQCMKKKSTDKIKISEIVKFLKIPNAAVSRVLKSIESDGMIIRTVDVVDRRNTYVELTEKGRNLIDNAMKFIDEFYSRVILKFGEEKLSKLQEMLTECRETAKTELTDMLENRKVSDS